VEIVRKFTHDGNGTVVSEDLGGGYTRLVIKDLPCPDFVLVIGPGENPAKIIKEGLQKHFEEHGIEANIRTETRVEEHYPDGRVEDHRVN